jgi:hypothetical protein
MFVFICIFLYFVITDKKRKYPFDGPTRTDGEQFIKYGSLKNKSKKKKKVFSHEVKCREIFIKLFGGKFKSVRPDWLENPVTGKNLELDGFHPDIKTPIGRGLAFEYDGKQHASYVPHFHRGGKNEFIYQTKKDSWKDLKCKEKGILLIRIPHFILFNDLEEYIIEKCKKNGLNVKSSNFYF